MKTNRNLVGKRYGSCKKLTNHYHDTLGNENCSSYWKRLNSQAEICSCAWVSHYQNRKFSLLWKVRKRKTECDQCNEQGFIKTSKYIFIYLNGKLLERHDFFKMQTPKTNKILIIYYLDSTCHTCREDWSNGPQIISFGLVLYALNMRCEGVPSIVETTTFTFLDNSSGSHRFKYCCLSSSSWKQIMI